MPDWFSLAELTALVQVVIIDVALAGDNAIVVGMAAAGLAADDRRRAIFWGIVAATVLRIVFALFTTQLLQIVGLLFAGGILLLWVCWKLWREIRADHAAEAAALENAEGEAGGGGTGKAAGPAKTFRRRDPDRAGRRVDVARQRAGRGRHRARGISRCWSSASPSPSR